MSTLRSQTRSALGTIAADGDARADPAATRRASASSSPRRARSSTSAACSDAPIEEIARSAGIARGLIYRHFSSKEELFVLTVTDYLDELAGVLRDAVAAPGDPPTSSTECTAAYASFCQRYPAFLDCALSLMQRPARELHAIVSESVWLRLGQGMATLRRAARRRPARRRRGRRRSTSTTPTTRPTSSGRRCSALMHLARIGVGVRQAAPGIPDLFARRARAGRRDLRRARAGRGQAAVRRLRRVGARPRREDVGAPAALHPAQQPRREHAQDRDGAVGTRHVALRPAARGRRRRRPPRPSPASTRSSAGSGARAARPPGSPRWRRTPAARARRGRRGGPPPRAARRSSRPGRTCWPRRRRRAGRATRPGRARDVDDRARAPTPAAAAAAPRSGARRRRSSPPSCAGRSPTRRRRTSRARTAPALLTSRSSRPPWRSRTCAGDPRRRVRRRSGRPRPSSRAPASSRRERAQALLAPRDEDEREVRLAGQPPGRRLADPARGPGDDGDAHAGDATGRRPPPCGSAAGRARTNGARRSGSHAGHGRGVSAPASTQTWRVIPSASARPARSTTYRVVIDVRPSGSGATTTSSSSSKRAGER